MKAIVTIAAASMLALSGSVFAEQQLSLSDMDGVTAGSAFATAYAAGIGGFVYGETSTNVLQTSLISRSEGEAGVESNNIFAPDRVAVSYGRATAIGFGPDSGTEVAAFATPTFSAATSSSAASAFLGVVSVRSTSAAGTL